MPTGDCCFRYGTNKSRQKAGSIYHTDNKFSNGYASWHYHPLYDFQNHICRYSSHCTALEKRKKGADIVCPLWVCLFLV